MASGLGGRAPIGIVGWGRMGAPMGEHLIRGGWSVMAHDVKAEARDEIEERGATWASTPAELAASCPIVLVVVSTDDQVRSVCLSPDDGLVAAVHAGSTVVICSSIHLQTCTEIGAALGARRARTIDAAMSGGEQGARDGRMTLLCGGEPETVDSCRPVFAAFATNVEHVGGLGAGVLAKAINNGLLLTAIQADVELLRLAASYGLDLARLRRALSLASGANTPLTRWHTLNLRFPSKDLANLFDMADSAGVELPFLRSLEPLVTKLTVADLHELT